MQFLDTFLAASQSTQYLIIGINLVAALGVFLILLLKNWSIKAILITLLYTLLFYMVSTLAAMLPILYFLVLYILPSLLIGAISYGVYLLVIHLAPEKEVDVFDIEIPYNKGKKMTVNIRKGASVQGAAGSGKTISIAGWILYWMGKRNVSGLVYDYKNFEFIEIVQWAYKESTIPTYVFAPHDPDKSIFLNPISLDVIKKPEDIMLMGKCIVQNLLGSESSGNKFFIEAAEGAIIGAIIVLKECFPQYCSFPYLTAIFLTKDAEELIQFIGLSQNASIQARAFLDGADSEKQMAGVKASLSNAFRVLAVPSIFYCMQRNSIKLNINNKENLSVLCLANIPKYDDIYSPILSIITQAVLTAISERGQEPCYLLLDEAPTLKINRIGKVPATMRSFGVATVYMLQDKIQAQIQMGSDKMKEILANLSTLFFGKTNDPDTAKFFESYFEIIKVKSKSTSQKAGGMMGGGTDRRVSESEREEKSHKAHEMFQRETGAFFVFDEKGKSFDAEIKMADIEPVPYKNTQSISEREIQKNYEFIIQKAKSLGTSEVPENE